MQHRRALGIVGALAALTLVAAACSNSSSSASSSAAGGTTYTCDTDPAGCYSLAPGDPFRFGTLLAISGGAAFLGNDSQNGVALGVDYLDGTFDATPGQLLGHDVEIQKEDDGCSKEGGQKGATKLANDPTILAVVGTSCSSSALGVADQILSDKGMILISPSNTAADLTASETHAPFYARTAQNDAIQAKVVSDFVYSNLGLTQAATIHDESPYATGLANGFGAFFEDAGGKITAAESITSTDTDFKSLLTSIAQTNPQLIYLPNFNPACGLIAKQAADIPELDGVKLMGSDGCLDSSFPDVAGSAADGFYLSGPIPSPATTQSELTKQYNAAYKDQFGKPTSSFNTNAFDAFNLLVEAVKATAVQNSDGSIDIPRTAMRDALFATNGYQGMSGTLTCNSTGDCQSVATVNIGVYSWPNAPIEGGTDNAKPVFSEELTLEEALNGGSGSASPSS
jgi:branched-chain amino acid transport system substrate-binding protein